MIPTVSVVVCARTENLASCLEGLLALEASPSQLIVVASAADDRTSELLRDRFPTVRSVPVDLGAVGADSWSRGYRAATGDIVAYLDDVVRVEPAWLNEIVAPYTDPTVVAVGGRVVMGSAGEKSRGLGRIGRLVPDGRLTDYFGADPGRLVEVDHLSRSNVSFRRRALVALGGVQRRYPDGEAWAEPDISLRLRSIGRLVFNPRAVAHRIAPQPRSRPRLDLRGNYLSRRNHVVMLVRIFGWRNPLARRYAGATARSQRAYGVEFLMRFTPYWGRADGSRRPLRMRLTAPAVLLKPVAEFVGLIAGYPVGMLAWAHDRRARTLVERVDADAVNEGSAR